MKTLKLWAKDENQKTINYTLSESDCGRQKLEVHVTESWNAEDTGHVLLDFTIQTENGHITETVFIPKAAFKELIAIQKSAKVSKEY